VSCPSLYFSYLANIRELKTFILFAQNAAAVEYVSHFLRQFKGTVSLTILFEGVFLCIIFPWAPDNHLAPFRMCQKSRKYSQLGRTTGQ